MFRVLSENFTSPSGHGAVGAGELAGRRDDETGEIEYPAATHKFRATRDGEVAFEGVTDGEGHDALNAWAKSLHKIDGIKFTALPKSKAKGEHADA